MDVCNEDSTRRAVERAVSEGGLGIVLNCAGMGIAGPAEDTFEEAVRAQFEVNYFGTLRVNRMVLPYFRAARKRAGACNELRCGARARFPTKATTALQNMHWMPM